MNITMPLSNNELFFQAINQPESVGEEVILALIEKYPYAQSLRFIHERKIFGESKPVQNLSATLLYAPSPNWLYEFMHSTVVVAKELQLEDITLDEEIEDEVSDDIVMEEAVVAETEVDQTDANVEEVEKADELERLIQAGVAQDYFRSSEAKQQSSIVDASEAVEPAHVEVAVQSSKDTQERVTVYDDDTMPYSFLWWLHKTRLEYAETYQPYVKSPLGRMTPSNDDIAKIHEKLDSQLLDQQIRENIFHLQSPEAKLSDEVKTTIAFQIPRKTDEVIEKFIREEPMIQPLQAEKLDLENKARKSSEDQHSLVTETLAKIYAEQGLYPKAIEVYEKLVLKYPEKNAYFAARITELEKKLN
ncbi:MAG: hypothetical protein K0R59_4468 [Sphingobacterium sp.]|jgi:tetratricopeptide (TPR) repeat protein|uniref:hypothetical protein n=1 Tax=Sphingobacterium sp. CZ-UAM TaxID=1933868 RepID=UPI0009CD53D7|nr:hypothetical protein [Sphingobacterium sp. CZ-UAM]MDF2519172.1 hypothetical protein [Sphingobacterium sp.]OOG16556.1 hypothetical protein BWD42_20190 [Sphingobacterium sp. CZ-UAM]